MCINRSEWNQKPVSPNQQGKPRSQSGNSQPYGLEKQCRAKHQCPNATADAAQNYGRKHLSLKRGRATRTLIRRPTRRPDQSQDVNLRVTMWAMCHGVRVGFAQLSGAKPPTSDLATEAEPGIR